MNIAIIPARSGSVRLKDKNIQDFHGVPLLIHTVVAAIDSGLFDIVHVSTDTDDIANIVRSFGIDVPVLRSKENSSSTSSSMSVILEVVCYYENKGAIVTNIALLQPTSPLRNSRHIISAFELLKDDVYSVISVTKPYSDIKVINNYLKSKQNLTNQDFKNLFGNFILNGAIYLLKRNNLNAQDYYNNDSVIFEMEPEYSIDIDSKDDFDLALILFEKNRSNH